MNKKSTKRTLLTSVLSVVLCMAMLIGTTFAWFTDSVTSAGNTIQSGTLDVDLVDAAGNSMEGEVIEFITADNRAQDAILWEPGCTYETEAVFVANKGNLALKYQIAINGITGDAKLLEAIEWTVTVNDAETALADLNGKLLAGETSKAIVISGHMKEEAGNEYQGLTVEGISISVVATQLAYESDSFNDLYDELATYMNKNANGEWEIDNIGQLIYLSKSVNEGNDYADEKIILTNDIDLAGINWMPIGSWDMPFKGTFDGQGHTISNLTINAPTREEVGLFGCTMNATIKGIKVKNVDILGYSQVAAIVGTPYSGCSISDCHVSGSIEVVADYAYAGGIAAYGYVDIENCSVIADGTGIIAAKERNAVGGICAWLLENGNSIKNCTAENLDLTGWANVGSIAGFVHYNNVVENCSAKNINLVKTRVDGNPSIGALFGGWCYGANKTITVNNNKVEDVTMSGNAIAYNFAKSELYGSEYYGATTDIFVENNNSYDYESNVVVVQVAKDVATLTTALANGGNIVVTSDISVSETTFSIPVGVTAVLNMNGKTIKGTFNNTSNSNKNLFEIKGNLTVDGEGLITMDTTGLNMGWNAMSCTLCVNGGDLTVNNAIITNKGGTDMAYAIDTNPWNPASNEVLDVVLNNVKVESTYRGIRIRDNGPYLAKLVATDSDIDEIWYQKYASGDNVNKGNYGVLVEVVLNNTTCDTSRVDSSVLTIN